MRIGAADGPKGASTLKGWEFAREGQPADYPQDDVFSNTYEELKMIDNENSILARLRAELRQAAEKCPNCQGAREYVFLSRGRENIVNCVRCEAIHKLLEPIEVAWEIFNEETQKY